MCAHMSPQMYPPTGDIANEECPPCTTGTGTAQIYPSTDFRICRICLESDTPADDPLIAPCLCAGSMQWVHRKCLDEWRAQDQVPMAFTHCPQCKFQYRTEFNDGEQALKWVKLTVFVARDTVSFFVAVQVVLGGLAFLLHACDPAEKIASLYPPEWAARKSPVHLSIGPYYVTTCIAVLALLGFVGLCLWWSGRLPWQTREARHAPRWRRPQHDRCCDNTTCDCPVTCYVIDCPECGCPGDCNCAADACGCDCNGEAAGALVVVGLVLVAFFAVMGLVFGLFFSVVIVQRIVQRHVRLLHMRSESKVYRVLDLADRPALLDVPERVPERDARPSARPGEPYAEPYGAQPYEAPHASLLARDGAEAV